MTYKEIFKELYYENKKFIYIYLTICLVFSVLAFGNAGLVHATEVQTVTEVVGALGGDFGKVFAPVAQGYLSGIDTPSVLLILCTISLILDYIPVSALTTLGEAIDVNGLEALKDYSFGIIDFNIFRILCLTWFIIVKLLRSNRLTYTTGVILEDVETKIGALITALVVATQFLANIPLETSVQAAVSASSQTAMLSQTTIFMKNSFNALLCFVLLVSVMVTYFFVRYLFYFLDIILVPVCSAVNFTATGLEVAKTAAIVLLLYISVFHPYVFCIIFAIMLILAIVFFKKAYITIRYFKAVYVKPFFKGIVGFDPEISLISAKVPGKVKRFVGETNAEIIMPVYLHKKVSDTEHTVKHERWWFVSADKKQYICKPCFMKNTCHCIELQSTDEQKMFIKKSLRFFEVFNLADGEENIAKTFKRVHTKVHFVFSKEYYYRFHEIQEITSFVDYTIYKSALKQNIKLSQKEAREQKRQERLEAKEELRLSKKMLSFKKES